MSCTSGIRRVISLTKPTSYAAGELLGRREIAERPPNEAGARARKVHIFEFWNDSALGCTKLTKHIHLPAEAGELSAPNSVKG
jgi:hypothetical protein